MIKVILFTHEKHLIGFEIKGHAGYDDYGKDIVCASVSVLAINTVNGIETFTKDSVDVRVDEKSGYLKCRLEGDMGEQSELLLKTFQLGVDGILKQYGKRFIDVQTKEV